jgi:adenosyl cobinamide kinase/adenosyl cobinamide phosphate guanylyltransferase
MTLVLLLGGARSGKSQLALALAARQPGPVVFIATARAGDEEMAARIERHRRERPAGWTTVEEPLELRGAIESVDPAACVVVDCLSLWTANLLERLGPDEVEAAAGAAAASAQARPGTTIAVSNEVGMGLVPMQPLGRRYRDLLGHVNRMWADASARVALVVAGRVLPLERAALFFDEVR